MCNSQHLFVQDNYFFLSNEVRKTNFSMPPKRRITSNNENERSKKTSSSSKDDLTITVGGEKFSIPISSIKSYPNTMLGSMLLSVDDIPSDLDFPQRNSNVFEQVVVPYYTKNGSLGLLNFQFFHRF